MPSPQAGISKLRRGVSAQEALIHDDTFQSFTSMDPADLKLLKPHKLRNHIAQSVGATIDRCIYLTGSEKRADSESKGFEMRLRKAGFEVSVVAVTVSSGSEAWATSPCQIRPQGRYGGMFLLWAPCRQLL